VPNGLFNWSYRDVTDFLKSHSFEFHKEVAGSHEHWIDKEKKYIVDVNFIQRSESYPPRTLETMIRNTTPLLDKKHWKKWAKNRGNCC